MNNGYIIEPRNERFGKEMGWFACPIAEATIFAVCTEYETVAIFDALSMARLAYPLATITDDWEEVASGRRKAQRPSH